MMYRNFGTQLWRPWTIAICLLAFAGCAAQPSGSGTGRDPGLPEPTPGEEIPEPVTLRAFLSTDRSRLIRDDDNEGRAELTVRTSACATFAWSIEPPEAEDILEIDKPSNSVPGLESVLRILSVEHDPGAEGTQVTVRVVATPFIADEADQADCPPPDSEETTEAQVVLTIVRPAGALAASLSSANTVAPGKEITLTALIRGGKPFIGEENRCRQTSDNCDVTTNGAQTTEIFPCNNGRPYCATWTFREELESISDTSQTRVSRVQERTLSVGPFFDKDGDTEMVATYAAPSNGVGNVVFELTVSDQSGNRATATRPIRITSEETLAIAEASAVSTEVAPGRTMGLSAKARGGTPPYAITFEIDPGTRNGGLTVEAPGACRLTRVNERDVLQCTLEDLRADDLATATYSAAPDKVGSESVTVRVRDAVGAVASTVISFLVASPEQLNVSAAVGSPVIDLDSSTAITATVSGGTAPYTVCFKPTAESIRGGSLSAGGSLGVCHPLTGFDNCTCITQAGPVNVTRTYTSPVEGGVASIQVEVLDFVRARASDVESINIQSGPGGGGGGPTSACSGGFVTVTAVAEEPSLCSGGSTDIIATPVGGTGPYEFTFTLAGAAENGEGFDVDTNGLDPTDTASPTTTCASNDGKAEVRYLAPSSGSANRVINVVVREAGFSIDSTIVNVATNLAPLVDAGIAADRCASSADFAVGGSPTASGGTGSLSFAWSGTKDGNPLPASVFSNPNAANPVFRLSDSATGAGAYVLTVEVDDQGPCTPPGSPVIDTVSFTIDDVPAAEAGSNQVVCRDASDFAVGGAPTASGGTPPFTYEWTGTGAPFLTVTDSENPVFQPGAAPPGSYSLSVKVTDANGCTATDSTSVTVRAVPTASAGPDVQRCDNASAVVVGGAPTASGGTAPLQIIWTGSGAGFLSSTSAANPTFDAAAAGPGTYLLTVTVVDAPGCDAVDEMQVTVHEAPTVNAGLDSATCDNGPNIVVGGSPTAVGGTPPYTYAWTGTGAEHLNLANVANPTFNVLAAPAGIYALTVTVTDANGCSVSDTRSIELFPLPSASAGPDALACKNLASIAVGGTPTASGGTPPFTITWTGTGASFLSSTSDANPNFDVSAAPQGDYSLTVTVMDDKGCSALDSMTVAVRAAPTADAGPNVTACDNGSNIAVGGVPTGSGGTGPYGFVWSGTGAIHLNSTSVSNPIFNVGLAPPGTYALTVTVTDANGCTASDTASVELLPLPTADAGSDVQACRNEPDPTLAASASGGTPPYAFGWSGTGTPFLNATNVLNPTFDVSSAPQGTYSLTLTVTDDRGCTATDTTLVEVRNFPTANAGPDFELCDDEPNFAVGGSPTASGGTLPYTFEWTGSGATLLNDDTLANPTFDVASATPGTTYSLTVTVRDNNGAGCIASDTMQVTVRQDPTANAGNPAPVCETAATVSVGGAPTASGGNPPYVILWSGAGAAFLNSDNVSNPTFDVAAAGAGSHPLTVTVTDDSGCEDSDDVNVVVQAMPTVNAGPDQAVPAATCNGTVITLAGSATGFASVKWIGGQGNSSFNGTDTLLNAEFTIGQADCNNGFVDLTLLAVPLSPCDPPAVEDTMRITVVP